MITGRHILSRSGTCLNSKPLDHGKPKKSIHSCSGAKVDGKPYGTECPFNRPENLTSVVKRKQLTSDTYHDASNDKMIIGKHILSRSYTYSNSKPLGHLEPEKIFYGYGRGNVDEESHDTEFHSKRSQKSTSVDRKKQRTSDLDHDASDDEASFSGLKRMKKMSERSTSSYVTNNYDDDDEQLNNSSKSSQSEDCAFSDPIHSQRSRSESRKSPSFEIESNVGQYRAFQRELIDYFERTFHSSNFDRTLFGHPRSLEIDDTSSSFGRRQETDVSITRSIESEQKADLSLHGDESATRYSFKPSSLLEVETMQVRHYDVTIRKTLIIGKMYCCPSCPFCFTTISMFDEHYNHHSYRGRYLCSYCTYGTDREDDLMEHLRYHEILQQSEDGQDSNNDVASVESKLTKTTGLFENSSKTTELPNALDNSADSVDNLATGFRDLVNDSRYEVQTLGNNLQLLEGHGENDYDFKNDNDNKKNNKKSDDGSALVGLFEKPSLQIDPLYNTRFTGTTPSKGNELRGKEISENDDSYYYSSNKNLGNSSKKKAVDKREARSRKVLINETKYKERSIREESRYPCSKCPAKLASRRTVNYHMSLHGCGAPLKCSQCDYAVKTIPNLKRHEKLHQHLFSTKTHRLENISINRISTKEGTCLNKKTLRLKETSMIFNNTTPRSEQQSVDLNNDSIIANVPPDISDELSNHWNHRANEKKNRHDRDKENKRSSGHLKETESNHWYEECRKINRQDGDENDDNGFSIFYRRSNRSVLKKRNESCNNIEDDARIVSYDRCGKSKYETNDCKELVTNKENVVFNSDNGLTEDTDGLHRDEGEADVTSTMEFESNRSKSESNYGSSDSESGSSDSESGSSDSESGSSDSESGSSDSESGSGDSESRGSDSEFIAGSLISGSFESSKFSNSGVTSDSSE